MPTRGCPWTTALLALLLSAAVASAQEGNPGRWSLLAQLGLPPADNEIPEDELVQRAPDPLLETLPPPRAVPRPAVLPWIAQGRPPLLVELAAASDMTQGTLKKAVCVDGDCPGPIPPHGYQERWMCLRDHFTDHAALLRKDFCNMYFSWNLLGLGAAIGIAAPLADTSGDSRFDTWYQSKVRNHTVDHWAEEGRRFGNYWIVAPVVIGAAAAGSLCPETTCGSVAGEFGCRSLRGLIVGAPTVAILQVALGSGTPGSDQGSTWHPREGRGAVATEAFVGAVPFLTAASMTKCRPVRWAFVGGSFIATWAGLHQDSHYLSQSLLGWAIGAVAVCSVNDTEAERGRIQFTPIAVPQGVGAGVQIQY